MSCDTVFQSIRFQIAQLTKTANEDDRRKKRQWKDDSEALEAYIAALSATKSVLKEEQNSTLLRVNRQNSKREAEEKLPRNSIYTKQEVQEKLKEFKNRIKEAENRVEQAAATLSVAERSEERCLLEDQIAIMGDTRQLCLHEAEVLEVMLKEMEEIEQRQKERKRDWETLHRLKRQLSQLEGKIDASKRSLLFPSVDGYRFRAGTGGIYIGAKDLYISELTGGFSLTAESIEEKKTAVVRMQLGGREQRSQRSNTPEAESYDHRSEEPIVDANELNNALPPSPTPSISSPSEPAAPFHHETNSKIQGLNIQPTSTDRARHPLSNSIPQGETSSMTAPVIQATVLETMQETVDTAERSEIQKRDLSADPTVKLPTEDLSIDPPPDPLDLAAGRNQESLSPSQEKPSKRRLAVKFLNKLAEKKEKLKTAPIRLAPLLRRKKDRAPSIGDTLLKKFVLDSEEISQRAVGEGQEEVLSLDQGKTVLEKQNLEEIVHRSSPEIDSTTAKATTDPQSSKEQSFKTSFFSWKKDASSETFSDSTSIIGTKRKGVRIELQGNYVSIIGEKGTRVPNITVKEITLEVECLLSCSLEFTESHGWQSTEGLRFEVVQLKKKAIGNSVPLPAGLVKTLLNLILPKVVERALLAAMPQELGMYILDAGKGCTAAGETIIMGPPLSTTQAALDTPSPFGKHRHKSIDLKHYAAVQEAQKLLSLAPDQAILLSQCFSKGQWGLLDAGEGWTGSCSVRDLCRFYDRYARTNIWEALCDLWNKALGYVARSQGIQSTLDFAALMNGRVARLAAKPVRMQCLFTRLNFQLDIDAALVALRDYCERSAKELDTEEPWMAGIPLEDQLKALQEWYLGIKARLTTFKADFTSFMATVVARADAKSLSMGLEKAQYEGPVALQMPIGRGKGDLGMMSFDVSIPSPGNASSTQFIDGLTRALHTIHAFKNETDTSQDDTAEGSLEWGIGTDADRKLNRAMVHPTDITEFDRPLTVGKAFLKKFSTAMAFDPDALIKQLVLHLDQGDGRRFHLDDLRSAVASLDDVISCGMIHDTVDGYTFSLRSGRHARLKCLVDSLGFQSHLSPAEILSMLHICIKEYSRTFLKDAGTHWIQHLMHHLIRYVDKRSLDVLLYCRCMSQLQNDRWMVSVDELDEFSNIRYPIQITNDVDVAALMDSLSVRRLSEAAMM